MRVPGYDACLLWWKAVAVPSQVPLTAGIRARLRMESSFHCEPEDLPMVVEAANVSGGVVDQCCRVSLLVFRNMTC